MRKLILLLSIVLILFTSSCSKDNENNSNKYIIKNLTHNDDTISFYTISNPKNLNQAGIPRDKKIIEKELNNCKILSFLIESYTNNNGLEKTVAEINKGRKGEFGLYMPNEHFYLSFSENILGENKRTIIAHATLPATIGFDIPELSMIKDNNGWAYNSDMQDILIAENYNHGLIEELIWTDPSWSPNSCRMTAFYTLFNYEGKEYNLYSAIWLDK